MQRKVDQINIANILLTQRCNLKCSYCHLVQNYEGKPTEYPDVQEYAKNELTAEGWINGAFFVLEPGIFDYIKGDHIQWEREPMEQLAKDGQLMAYQHPGFWQCMDTLRDKRLLNDLWDSGQASWKTWKEKECECL